MAALKTRLRRIAERTRSAVRRLDEGVLGYGRLLGRIRHTFD